MERIDKIISSQTSYSRKEVKELISKKKIFVNDILVKKSDEKIDVEKDIIKIDGNKLNIKEHIYLILNKPKGYVSATKDNKDKTVLDLVPDEYKIKDLFPAGRLDKNTTGLMIITDDGEFAHNILSPSKHVKKVYEVEIDIPVNDKMAQKFKEGIDLKDVKCKSADFIKIGDYKALVTLREGRYHQIKRMFGMFGAKVTLLNRIQMGNLKLPEDMLLGNIRELTKEELELVEEKREER